MIDWHLAVSLWDKGYNTYSIARYIGNQIDEIVYEWEIYNLLPHYREFYK